jgi:hypothetical protein
MKPTTREQEMSTFRDVVARMAVDPEFARYARSQPDEVARAHGLTAEETQRLRSLSDAQVGVGPQALGARLSKSGIGTGGIGLLAAEADPALAGDAADPADPPTLGEAPPVTAEVDVAEPVPLPEDLSFDDPFDEPEPEPEATAGAADRRR